MYVVNKALAERVERSEAALWASLMQGLPEGYQADIRRFGPLTVLTCPGMAKRSFLNRIFGARDGAGPDLNAALDWFTQQRVTCRVDLCPLLAGEESLARVRAAGFQIEGFQMALFSEVRWVARSGRRTLPQGVAIRVADSQEDLAFAARTMPIAFDSTGEPWLTWLTDSMRASFTRPDYRTYIALVDGQPAGFAQLHMADGVGSLALAGTLPQFRGRGVQTALIHRRIDDAAEAGCDLIATQTGSGTVSQWNMERAGLRIAYTKAELYRR